MTSDHPSPELVAELEALRTRLAETEETLRAIRDGEVDALVTAGSRGAEVQLLGGGDRIYRQFIETVSEGTATLSAAGVIQCCNAALAKTLRRGLDQVVGTAMRDHLSPADREEFVSVLARAGLDSLRRKIRLKTSEGALVPVYLSASLLQSSAAEPVICLVFTDLEEVISAEQTLRGSEEQARAAQAESQRLLALSEQSRLLLLSAADDTRRSAEALRESEEKYSKAFRTSPYAITITRPDDGNFIEVNDAFLSMTGFTREEALGDSSIGLKLWVNEEDRQRVVTDLRAGRVVATQEHLFRTKGGEVIHGLFSAQVIQLSQGPCILSSISDITARKRAEADRLRLSVAIEEAGEPVMITDAKGTIQYVNPAFETVTGYSRAEALGKNSRILKSGEHDEALYRGAVDTIRSGRVWRGRLANSRKDGSLYTVDTTISPVHDEAGRIVSYVGVERDITEQLRLADEKVRIEDQLRQAQKVEAIGRLAGGVAHDFNNLTAIVLGYGEMLLGQLSPEDPARNSVEQIVEAGQRSAALTRQLLAFSRKQVLQAEVLELNPLLHNLEKMLGRIIGEDIQLELKLAENLGRVTADPGQIEQVVTNLVVNARDAMPRGGRLTIETADVELDEIYSLDHASVVPGRYVLLAVTDTGCGMARATLDKIYEPFFTTKEMGKGTGLGLATVYGIVKQSGGYIWAYSEPGKGTAFKIYLPRTDAAPAVKVVEFAGETPRGNGERILLVEDEVSLRELCEKLLSGLGYRVSAAGSGPQALLLVEEQRLAPDLVITDVIMPLMSGSELAQRLRGNRPDLRVLYMSGYPDDAIARHGVLEPGTPFIQKPFTERSLAIKVRETLGGVAAVVQPDRRVLMIDDDEQFRELVRHFCAKRGHSFAGVGSAAAALASLAKQTFDVLLVDLNIPGTDGERILREIRAAGHAAPAIVLTGDVASADLDLLRPLGVVRALAKSSDPEPLLQAIAEAAGLDSSSPHVRG